MSIKISDTASSPAGDKPVKINTYVSLNMKRSQFYAIDTFVLSADEPTAKGTGEVSKEER